MAPGKLKEIMNQSESNTRDDHVKSGLFESNQDLVVEIAKSYDDAANSKHIDLAFTLDELVKEGRTGLRLATERFELQNSVAFSNYVSWWIRQAMLRGLFQVRKFPDDRSAPDPQARLQRLGAIPEFRADIECLLLELFDKPERSLLRLRFGLDRDGEPRTLAEVSEHFHWSRERVRQIEARSLSKILHYELTDLNFVADRLTND